MSGDEDRGEEEASDAILLLCLILDGGKPQKGEGLFPFRVAAANKSWDKF